MTDSAKLPKIVILGTGGTIVSSGDDPLMLTGYRIKGLNVETLLCAVPELQYFARIEAHQIANIDSSSMTYSIWLELGRAIEKAAADPDTAGIVVTHGTDTMEETAWFTHLTAKTQKPIVFTGAMRPATALSADGPLNLHPQPFDWDALLGLLHKKPPRRSSYEAQLSDSDSLVTTTQIAKEYGCGAKVFNRLLHLHGIQYRANGQWVLYSEHHGKGYTSSLTFRLQRSDGSEVEKLHTAWTQKGRKFLYHTLKRRGVLPLAEQGG